MHRFGILVRVPAEGLAGGMTPAVHLQADDGTRVSNISEDPWIGLDRARAAAANLDLR